MCSEFAKDCTAMIPPCTMLDHTIEPDEAQVCERVARSNQQKHYPQRRVNAKNHLQVIRLATTTIRMAK